MIVDLGGVGHYKNGTVTVNIDPDTNPDIVCDFTASANQLNLHFDPLSVNMFTCIHTLEHLEPHEAMLSMKYWSEFLEPNSRLLIVVPDTEKIIEDYINKKISADVAISILFRNSPYEQMNQWAKHRWAWTDFTLRRDMTNAGYNTISPERQFVPDFWTYDYKGFEFTGAVGEYQVPNLKIMGIKK